MLSPLGLNIVHCCKDQFDGGCNLIEDGTRIDAPGRGTKRPSHRKQPRSVSTECEQTQT
jgi:hypothetical protein